MKTQALQIMVSINSQALAKDLIVGLLNARLIACGQCLPEMNSYYRWQGDVHCDEEFLMLLKTQRQHYEAIEQWLIEHHPYDTPEIIAVEIVAGNNAYLNWINDETLLS